MDEGKTENGAVGGNEKTDETTRKRRARRGDAETEAGRRRVPGMDRRGSGITTLHRYRCMMARVWRSFARVVSISTETEASEIVCKF